MPVRPNAVHPELAEGLSLLCHPNTPTSVVESIGVQIDRTGPLKWRCVFTIEGGVDALKLPKPSAPLRTDGLWQTTCCEVFFRLRDAAAYVEFNLSPSGAWAAYAFNSYRDVDRRDAELPAYPEIDLLKMRPNVLVLTANLHLPGDWVVDHAALSAVIEETDGTKSCWALRHPPGKPDFHHPDCFALTLGAPGAP